MVDSSQEQDGAATSDVAVPVAQAPGEAESDRLRRVGWRHEWGTLALLWAMVLWAAVTIGSGGLGVANLLVIAAVLAGGAIGSLVIVDASKVPMRVLPPARRNERRRQGAAAPSAEPGTGEVATSTAASVPVPAQAAVSPERDEAEPDGEQEPAEMAEPDEAQVEAAELDEDQEDEAELDEDQEDEAEHEEAVSAEDAAPPDDADHDEPVAAESPVAEEVAGAEEPAPIDVPEAEEAAPPDDPDAAGAAEAGDSQA